MKEKPIIFTSEMVKAILEGRKTQTRRVIKPQPTRNHHIAYMEGQGAYNCSGEGQFEELTYYATTVRTIKCPYGQPRDRLWVRETIMKSKNKREHLGVYAADDSSILTSKFNLGTGETEVDWVCHFKKNKISAIFMPRWASRIILEITNIRVERLQEITLKDAIAEGIKAEFVYDPEPEDDNAAFKYLWNSINKTYPWLSNPWVWVISFKRVNSH